LLTSKIYFVVYLKDKISMTIKTCSITILIILWFCTLANTNPKYFNGSQCILFGSLHHGSFLVDENKKWIALCNIIAKDNDIIIGTVLSDSSFNQTTESAPGDSGWIKYQTLFFKVYKIRVDSMITGKLIPGNVINVSFCEHSNAGRKRKHFNENGKTSWEGEISFCGESPEYKFPTGLRALFVVKIKENEIIPITGIELGSKCQIELQKCIH
jgi:hypothetical protein